MTQNSERIERAMELLVYAPIGAGLYLMEVAPPIVDTVVARGRAEFDRRQSDVQRHVTTARSMGQVALAFGLPKLRSRVEGLLGRRLSTPPAPPPARASAPVATPPRPAPAPVPAAPSHLSVARDADAPDSDELPIPGYDALSASQVVERLAGLGREELDAVHAYEAAHRQRRTILGKIEQLAG